VPSVASDLDSDQVMMWMVPVCRRWGNEVPCASHGNYKTNTARCPDGLFNLGRRPAPARPHGCRTLYPEPTRRMILDRRNGRSIKGHDVVPMTEHEELVFCNRVIRSGAITQRRRADQAGMARQCPDRHSASTCGAVRSRGKSGQSGHANSGQRSGSTPWRCKNFFVSGRGADLKNHSPL
jgi:hypothetical protein